MKDSAIILTSGMFNSRNAKTAFGLVRHSEKYRILAVIDQNFAGQDAGEIVTGKNLNIPIYASIKNFLGEQSSNLNIAGEKSARGLHAIIGVATPGGVIPNELRQELLDVLADGVIYDTIEALHEFIGAVAKEGVVGLFKAKGLTLVGVEDQQVCFLFVCHL